MVTGIVGVATILLGGFLWPLVCGIAALVLSSIAGKNGQRNGMRTAGKICGIVALAAGVVLLVVTIGVLVASFSMVGDMMTGVGDVATNGKDVINGLGGY